MGDYNLQIHAQPYAFTRSTGTMDKDNNLICSYTYKSTSGSISDLGSCRWHERITYPGTGNAYIAPAPFSGAFINPTITPNEVMNTSLGAIGTLYDTDSGEYWPFVGPPFSASIPITVQFEYDDLSTGKSNILIPGPDAIDTIVRSITQSKPRYTDPTIWWYHITNQRLEGWVWLGSSGS